MERGSAENYKSQHASRGQSAAPRSAEEEEEGGEKMAAKGGRNGLLDKVRGGMGEPQGLCQGL